MIYARNVHYDLMTNQNTYGEKKMMTRIEELLKYDPIVFDESANAIKQVLDWREIRLRNKPANKLREDHRTNGNNAPGEVFDAINCYCNKTRNELEQFEASMLSNIDKLLNSDPITQSEGDDSKSLRGKRLLLNDRKVAFGTILKDTTANPILREKAKLLEEKSYREYCAISGESPVLTV